ncbi:Hypothetical predicted protein [Mytilus galloprovincialis]|uniref:Mab-21-like HhH/H2TH-like domain-containing protein n=1 Tax=Mytilus galloprovincialis TaxID=29158 RepID=A0A8B6GQ51_MYTGA|nr:Hypothetical predicted protein [Mytilus galloprovincialis]
MVNASSDRVQSYKGMERITSGSFGEGLELQGSDVDIMRVIPNVEITESPHQHIHDIDTDDIKPGFANLRHIKGDNEKRLLMCRDVEGQLYLSSVLFKRQFLTNVSPIIHGPCITDRTGSFDYAYCLHAKSWIKDALPWISRSNKSWPTSTMKQNIVDHGVLFVPIGVEQSLRDELQWRISFSVGEKLLIYSFTQTQFLCYALMKILLRDVISQSAGCKDLLCSYHIKTTLFWISEELPTSVWKPENLIYCFMKCFKRIVYYVENSLCPHYFISENNLFENKIIGHDKKKLLDTLRALLDYDWRCLFFSDQISRTSMLTIKQYGNTHNLRTSDLFVDDINKIVKSTVLFSNHQTIRYVRNVNMVLSNRSKKIRSIFLYNMTRRCCDTGHSISIASSNGNKYNYKQFKQCLCFLLQSTHHDASSGWLMVACLFYKTNQYNNAFHVLSYSLKKCTTEKLLLGTALSPSQRELLFRVRIFRKLGIIRSLRFILLDDITFPINSRLIPDELQIDVDIFPYVIPPVTLINFLTFLCHYHLHNVINYQESLQDIHHTIEEEYFISDYMGKASSYNCLGICYLMAGQAFKRSKYLLPDVFYNPLFRRLSLMESFDV